MRPARLLLPFLLAAAAFGAEAVHLDLKNGSKFDGRIASADDAAIRFLPTVGGEMKIAWKDLEPGSWLAAKKLLVDPKDGRALLELARFATENVMRVEAEALLASALRVDPSVQPEADLLVPKLAAMRRAEAEALFERARGFMEKSNWLQALGRFQAARKLDPTYAAAVNGVGEAYFSMRELGKARLFIDEAIKVDPQCKGALFNRAYLSLLELDFKACLSGLDEVVAVPPTPGKFATEEEALAEGTKRGITKPEESLERFADDALIQARSLRHVIAEIVKGPRFGTEFVATTEHYDLRSDVSQEYADLIASRMELIYGEYERRYSWERTGEQKTRGKKLRFPVLVFRNKEEYVGWFTRVLRNPALAAATGGVYVPIVKHLVFFQAQSFDETQVVAWHEGFHQYLDYFVGDVPLWFNEGQAEYYGGSRLDKSGKKLVVGQTSAMRVGQLWGMLEKRRLPGAEALMRLPRADFMRLKALQPGETAAWTASENYAASWALVHFCIEGDGKRWARNLLGYFKALVDGASADEAFETAWGRTDWPAFNAGFRAHARWLVERAVAEREGKPVPPAPR
jgi:tetratricopeptide (TPR) repeat protein